MRSDFVYALIDVDSMYTSVEQVVQPWLVDRAVVTLSNNDGCVIARSKQAKRLGVAMGQPWFQVRRDPRMRDVTPRSANFGLYGEFSARLLSLIEDYTPHVEPYSIDESYLALPRSGAVLTARRLREQIDQWLGLPVSIGLASTRTLAHVATKQAKTTGAGVCDLSALTPGQHHELLVATPITEVWGIADRLGERLRPFGITTAAELAEADAGWARRAFSVVLERTVRELRGTPCIPLEQDPPARQQCLHSRHLPQPVTSRDTLGEIASSFAATLSRRLRRHQRVTPAITVQVSTGAFDSGPRASVHATQGMSMPTAATTPIAAVASRLARRQWRPGYAYRRVTVLAHDLTTPATPLPLDEHGDVSRQESLAQALDAITARWGSASIGLGAAGVRQPRSWSPRQQHLWPVSTTDWHRLPLVYC